MDSTKCKIGRDEVESPTDSNGPKTCPMRVGGMFDSTRSQTTCSKTLAGTGTWPDCGKGARRRPKKGKGFRKDHTGYWDVSERLTHLSIAVVVPVGCIENEGRYQCGRTAYDQEYCRETQANSKEDI